MRWRKLCRRHSTLTRVATLFSCARCATREQSSFVKCRARFAKNDALREYPNKAFYALGRAIRTTELVAAAQ